ncbi:TonB-dependent receptor domain-containing protein [Aliikangiella sp. G2MR2-5]|uniref:TonB-dependent receptor domain-containing protein n=1 Tax=Aliikangiella sp. G2MR2-5 TaxID=2788943 RepID=UPI0018A98C06|nr:TonB-dependent receptor [Aliikangiella sp. G2MR2-5]
MKTNLVAASVIAAISTCSVNLKADETLVVTANRIQQNANEVLADIEIINRSDIEKIRPRTLVDLLETVAGIDVVKRGGHGQNSSMFVRGTNFNQTLILIDGIRIGSATLGETPLSGIAVNQIERVEIIKGARAAVWGSDAIGGVIQIFTRRFDSGDYQLSAEVGSNSSEARTLAAGFGGENFAHTFSYAMKSSDGIDARVEGDEDEDGSANESYAINGDYLFGDAGELKWLIQNDRSYSEFDTSWGGDKTRSDNELASLRYALNISGWSTSFTLASSKDKSSTFDQSTGNDESSLFVTNKKQASVLTTTKLSEKFNLVVGYDWYQDDISETTTAFPVEERDTNSYMAGTNYIGDDWLFDLVARHDDIDGVDSRISTNAAIGYQLDESQRLSLNFSQGFKAPSFNDLYSPFGGNPDLKFETSDNYELVYKGVFDALSVTSTFYRSDIDNLIQWAPTDGIWAPENVGQVKISGATFDLNYRVEQFTHGFNVSVTEPEDKASGERLIRRAKLQANYEIVYDSDNWQWGVQVNHAGNRVDSGEKLSSYTKLNLTTSYRFNEKLRMQLKINDLTEEEPVQVSGYNPLEQEIFLSVTYQNF